MIPTSAARRSERSSGPGYRAAGAHFDGQGQMPRGSRPVPFTDSALMRARRMERFWPSRLTLRQGGCRHLGIAPVDQHLTWTCSREQTDAE